MLALAGSQKIKYIYVFWFKWTTVSTLGKVGNGNWYAGEIQTINQTKIQWKWIDYNTFTTRTLGILQQQQPEPITDMELQCLHCYSTLHCDKVQRPITANIPQQAHT